MNCPACHHPNRDGARFCEDCASPLRLVCSGCGEELRPTSRFCDACGAPTGLAPAAPRSGATGSSPSVDDGPLPASRRSSASTVDTSRRIVTVVFADLAGSTALHERLDAESARLFMENYYAAMRRVIDDHGGRVAKLLGDGVMAVFGLPLVGEDDALRAVRAAVQMQAAFRDLAEQYAGLVGAIGLRIAANTGEVVARDDSELIGDPVNVAARLQEKAGDGDVVVGESTRRLVLTLVTLEPLGSLVLKGRAGAVAAHRVVSLEPPQGATTAAFVGREEELARLQATFDAAVSAPRTTLAVLLGSPGLGKSRLIDEFAGRLDDQAAVVLADCEAAGSATFAPLATALREFLGIAEGGDGLVEALENVLPESFAERARIRDGVAALLRGSPAPPEEAFFVVRRLLAAMASTRPLVLVIDDLQWASPLLLDLVEHLVQWGSGTPLLVLVGARPELRQLRSSLTSPGPVVSDVIALAGLDAGAAMRLAGNVIGASDLPAAAAARVLAASEGNPLFVGELVRMLVHEGALEHDGQRWTAGAGLASLEMPPTIHALLAARIERLRPEDRLVLERAAVVGRQFSRSAVLHLLSDHAGDLDASLESLRRSELVEPDTGWFLGEPALRFHHLLIRDAAYRRLLRNTRADLHGRLAEWIESKAARSAGSDGSIEHDEIIGWHLEQAFHHLRELGLLTEAARALGARASTRLAAAGRRSLARDDLPVAADLLGRALACLDSADPARAELALDWCEALLSAGDVGPAAGAVAELARFASESPRLAAWHTCLTGQLTALTAPQSLQATAEEVAAAARKFADLEDDAGEAKAHAVHAQILARLGRVGAGEDALDHALAAARRAGDRRRANAVLAGAPQAALWGPSPVTRASGRCLDVVRVLRITQGAPAVEAVALSCQGVLEALRGRTEAARRMVATARQLVEELGITHRLLETEVCAARIDFLEGKAAQAEKLLAPAYDGLRALGLDSDAAQAGALLARALLAQDRGSEAEEISVQCEALAGDDLQAAIAWRAVRAEALARRGEHAEAIALAEAGVAIAAATDALLDHALARLALAAAYESAGRQADARAEEKRARELWEAKGAVWTRGGATSAGADAASQDAGAMAVDGVDKGLRRVRENLATESFRRFTELVNALDVEGFSDLFEEDVRIVHHPTGREYDKSSLLDDLRLDSVPSGLVCRTELLASLGETLALGRVLMSAEGSEERGSLSFGAFEIERLFLVEVGPGGRRRHVEIFEPSRLTQAVIRLFELRAEQVPERRQSLLSIARVWTMVGDADPSIFTATAADEFTMNDRRRVIGLGQHRGPEVLTQALQALLGLTVESVWRVVDVLALTDKAGLQLLSHSGTLSDGGGAFERSYLLLNTFTDEGLVSLWEMFDADSIDEALASFDADCAEPPTPSRSLRAAVPNRASRGIDRLVEAVRSADPAAIVDCFAKNLVFVDHSNGATWGRDENLKSLKALLRSRDPALEMDLLATLGPSLALVRRRISASAAGGSLDMGEFEMLHFEVGHVDDDGRLDRVETFGSARLADAIARLYELYGEGLADEFERERAFNVARWAMALLVNTDVEEAHRVMSPDVEAVDHRLVGFGTLRGRQDVRKAMQTMLDLTEHYAWRVDEIEELTPLGMVVRVTNHGRDRSGGSFEREICGLVHFGEGTLLSRWEFLEGHDVARARARFQELVQPPPDRPPFDNQRVRTARFRRADAGLAEDRQALPATATRLHEPTAGPGFSPALLRFARVWRESAAVAASTGDWDRFRRLTTADFVYEDRGRRSLVRGDVETWIRSVQFLLEQPGIEVTGQGIASQGTRIAVLRLGWKGGIDGTAFEMEKVQVVELDEQGLLRAMMLFDREDRAQAFLEAQRRFAAGEAAASEAARLWTDVTAPYRDQDWTEFRKLLTPGFVFEDRRPLSFGRLDAEKWIDSLRVQASLTSDPTVENLEILGWGEGTVAMCTRISGTLTEGGPFENVFLGIMRTRQGLWDLYEIYPENQRERVAQRLRELDETAVVLPNFEPAT